MTLLSIFILKPSVGSQILFSIIVLFQIQVNIVGFAPEGSLDSLRSG